VCGRDEVLLTRMFVGCAMREVGAPLRTKRHPLKRCRFGSRLYDRMAAINQTSGTCCRVMVSLYSHGRPLLSCGVSTSLVDACLPTERADECTKSQVIEWKHLRRSWFLW
jgi:hypothetical protein